MAHHYFASGSAAAAIAFTPLSVEISTVKPSSFPGSA